MYKRVIVKIGSSVLSENGRLVEHVLESIVAQIAALRARGIEVVLITSGAVATGRGILPRAHQTNSVVEKQMFAAVGQVHLMAVYADLFKRAGHTCAQVLVTKEDFRDRQHYANMRNCLENLLASSVIPVVNENDVVAVTELLFTDNDELAGLIAAQLGADAVILLSSVPGVLRRTAVGLTDEVIPEIDFSREEVGQHLADERSALGRGGMHTKFRIAKTLAAEGIAIYLADGRRANIIVDLVDGKKIGTHFVPQKKLSAAKRRLAHAEGLAQGSVRVNACTKNILLARTVASLLPIGVIAVEGDFEKGDVIEVQDDSGTRLGFGIARADAGKVKAQMGKKGGSALIHYDYLFIE